MRPPTYRYKIELWEAEFTGDPLYVAFVRRRGWFLWNWYEIGRARSKDEAEQICRKHKKPSEGPWLYSADAI